MLEFCGGTYTEVLGGKTRVAGASDQINLKVVARPAS